MQSKIACTAGKLSLLQPDMIQQIVAGVAYQTGSQYAAENRVRLLTSDEAHITASVTGNYWMHEQDIKLKDGFLVSRCSCRVEEQPLCRHGIAALLAYQSTVGDKAGRVARGEPAMAQAASPAAAERAATPERPRRSAIVLDAQVVEAVTVTAQGAAAIARAAAAAGSPAAAQSITPASERAPAAAARSERGVEKNLEKSMEQGVERGGEGGSAHSRDLKFSEIALFIEWLQPAVAALRRGATMPGCPRDAHGEIEEWVRTLLGLQGQLAESEAGRQSLAAELQASRLALADKSEQMDKMNQQLQVARREARDAQARSNELQANLTRAQGVIASLQNLGRQLDQCEGQIRALGDELASKKTRHDELAGSFRDIAAALRPLGKGEVGSAA